MVPLEPWQKVHIRLTGNQTGYKDIDPIHATISCSGCHNGIDEVVAKSQSLEHRNEAMDIAHSNLIHDPSENPESTCGVCHPVHTENNQYSMHTSLWGEQYKVAMRAFGSETLENHPDIQAKFSNECASCHTTCGQCHVSRPNSVHGGFINKHKFQRTPDIKNNCVACHGSRIGVDYYGYNDGEGFIGNLPDVHLTKGKNCLFCHTENFHGDGTEEANPPLSRYAVNGIPSCSDPICHGDVSTSNNYHINHWPGNLNDRDLSCFVCHSQKYNNCNSCHTAGVWKQNYQPVIGESNVNEGTENYREYPEFRIAFNPAYGSSGSWSPSLELHSDSKWVLVRHSPIVRDTYEPWNSGINDLTNFDSIETWEYTSPHNIRLWTDRTDTTGTQNCFDNCHTGGMNLSGNGNKYFLWSTFVDSVSMSVDPSLNEIIVNSHIIVDGHIMP